MAGNAGRWRKKRQAVVVSLRLQYHSGSWLERKQVIGMNEREIQIGLKLSTGLGGSPDPKFSHAIGSA